MAASFSPDGKFVASVLGTKRSSSGTYLPGWHWSPELVSSVIFSPDIMLMVSALEDKTVRLWDSSTGAAVQILDEHSHFFLAVGFSPDGKLVASAFWDQTIRLWNSSTGTALQTLEEYSDLVVVVAFLLDGKLVASASEDNMVKLWDLSSGALLHTFETLTVAHQLSFSQDVSYIEIGNGFISYLPLSSNTCSLPQPDIVRINLQDRCIVETNGKIPCLPPDYKLDCLDVRNSSDVLGNQSGFISFISFWFH